MRLTPFSGDPRAIRSPPSIARPDAAGLLFDIRLQGDHETVFFDW